MYIYSSNVYHFTMCTGGVPVQYAEQPTNGVTYFRAISGISLLPEDLLIYVPLFCTIITQLVTCILMHSSSKYSYMQISGVHWVLTLSCTPERIGYLVMIELYGDLKLSKLCNHPGILFTHICIFGYQIGISYSTT